MKEISFLVCVFYMRHGIKSSSSGIWVDIDIFNVQFAVKRSEVIK